jgi:hypothetical protein
MTQRTLTFDDKQRLTGQLAAVRQAMINGDWWTLEEIRHDLKIVFDIESTTQSISARLRDLRKKEYGSHTVERQRVAGGLYRYRLKVRHDAT